MSVDTTAAKSGEIVSSTPRMFTTDELRGISNFDDALNLATAHAGTEIPLASETLGDGFALLESGEKDRLIGTDMILLDWTFSKGDFDAEFVSVRLVTRDGSRYIVNDGGTGICAQLRDYTDRSGVTGILRVERGLRKSTYQNEYTQNGVTYYLDTSAGK
jgi:hypothetical protein